MDFILAPADPERQRALPDDPGAGPHGGACAWRHHGTSPPPGRAGTAVRLALAVQGLSGPHLAPAA